METCSQDDSTLALTLSSHSLRTLSPASAVLHGCAGRIEGKCDLDKGHRRSDQWQGGCFLGKKLPLSMAAPRPVSYFSRLCVAISPTLFTLCFPLWHCALAFC